MAVQISNIGWQTLCCSRQTWDLLPPATKVTNTKWWWWYRYKIIPTQRHRNGQYWAPLLTIGAASKNQDQDLEFICCIFHIIVVNTTFSGWIYICFTVQHTCKCISLFMWHAIIVLQSASLITSAIQWPSSNTKPRDPSKLQIGEAPPHHRDLCPSLSWDIQT